VSTLRTHHDAAAAVTSVVVTGDIGVTDAADLRWQLDVAIDADPAATILVDLTLAPHVTPAALLILHRLGAQAERAGRSLVVRSLDTVRTSHPAGRRLLRALTQRSGSLSHA
jgi:hypothetical protein